MPKICYLAPLKALSNEKFEDWSKLFHDRKIIQLTGDILISQKIREEKMKEAETADIILMTCELLDSITRNHIAEQYQWIKDIELLIADEAHGIGMEERGHTIEVSLMRFCQIAPQAKIWFLSATLPNTEEFARWLETLNHKECEIINSRWRPTELRWHFIQHNIYGSYSENEDDKIAKAIALVQEHENESTLVFVHAKTTGRRVESILKSMGIQCEFYNADLEFEARKDLLARFEAKNGDRLPVLISTSALAWGSLTQNVKITMWDGKQKSLKDLKIGDYVQSWDEEDGDFVANEVIDKNPFDPEYELKIELENGTIIHCSPNHPFYVGDPLFEPLEIKHAEDLIVGDELFQRW